MNVCRDRQITPLLNYQLSTVKYWGFTQMAEVFQPPMAHSDSSWSHILNVKVPVEICLADGDLVFVVHKVEIFVKPFWYLKDCTCYFLIMYKLIGCNKMAPGHMLTVGVGALVTCLERLIHPSSLIRDNYSKVFPTMRLSNLKGFRPERKTVSQHLQEYVIFLSPSLTYVEFHSVQSYAKVTQDREK